MKVRLSERLRFRRSERKSELSIASAIGVLAALSFGVSAASADPESHAQNAQSDLVFVNREMGGVQAAVSRVTQATPNVDQRLANGEILYRTKDYSRAVVIFSEILEELCDENPCVHLPRNPSYADALWLRGETYYASHEYLSARRDFKFLVENGNDPRFQPYFGKSLARLIDVALRVNDPPEMLADIFARFNQIPPAQIDAGLLYAKGKGLYRQKDFSGAQQAFTAVAANTPYTHQAGYYLGLVAMQTARASVPQDPTIKSAASANYKLAIEAFRHVTDLPPDTSEHKHVIDLSWLAIGRLFYEMEQYQQASEAYAKVQRDSPEFDTMLYELSWVYVRLGDVQRAERALEVLEVSDPGSQYIGDGTLLRADLLLRSGAFDRQCMNGHCAAGALQLYEGVLAQYAPMLESVNKFLDKNKDGGVGVYYDKLVQQQLDSLDQNDALPPIATRWAREFEDGPAAFAVIDDINECKALIRDSGQLVERLTMLTGSNNAVKAFPELEAGEEAAIALLNRISRSRLEVARGLDDQEPSDLGGEINTVRNTRRDLMSQIDGMPTDQQAFSAREDDGLRQWNTVSQNLTQRSLEVDQLSAVVNGLRRMLKEDAQSGRVRDPQSTKNLQDELVRSDQELKSYRDEIGQLRKSVEYGRSQVGLGDSRYAGDDDARIKFRDAVEREVALGGQGQAGADVQKYSARVQPLVTQAHTMEDTLIHLRDTYRRQVSARTADLRQKIDTERRNLAGYQVQLDALDAQARDLVGQVAEKNFGLVRAKLKGVVLHADVGITTQAWEVRVEENARVTNLLIEKARQQNLLDEELHEVLDDGSPSQGNGQ